MNNANIAILITSAIIVAVYSAFGGIKAVTFTDIVQFITFGVMLPGVALIMWGTISDSNQISDVLLSNPKLSYKSLFYLTNNTIFECINALVFIAIPWLTPAIFQRIAMAKNTIQVKHSFFIASIVCACINIIISWLAILMLATTQI